MQKKKDAEFLIIIYYSLIDSMSFGSDRMNHADTVFGIEFATIYSLGFIFVSASILDCLWTSKILRWPLVTNVKPDHFINISWWRRCL